MSTSPLPRETLEELKAKMEANRKRLCDPSSYGLQPVAGSMPQKIAKVLPAQAPAPTMPLERPTAGPQLAGKKDKGIPWVEYPRIDPGQYRAICGRVRTYQDRRFQRHVCLLQFMVLGELGSAVIARLPLFLNLGSAKDGRKPRAGRCSLFSALWLSANGGPPRRGDRMSTAIFRERAALVEVADTTQAVRPKMDAGKTIYEKIPATEPYSIIKRILHWETASACHHVNKSTQAPSKAVQGKGL